MANHMEAASRTGAYPVTVGVTGSGAASMVSAASLLASRRHRTASRSPAPTRNAANTSTEQLLIEQNKLLLEQLKILQLQQQQQPSASSAGSDSLFCESNQVLQGIDPDLKQVFQSFEQETKHLLISVAYSEKHTWEVPALDQWKQSASTFPSRSQATVAMDKDLCSSCRTFRSWRYNVRESVWHCRSLEQDESKTRSGVFWLCELPSRAMRSALWSTRKAGKLAAEVARQSHQLVCGQWHPRCSHAENNATQSGYICWKHFEGRNAQTQITHGKRRRRRWRKETKKSLRRWPNGRWWKWKMCFPLRC